MKAFVLGASSGLGRALARRLASQGWALAIAARDRAELEAVAADARLRHGVAVHVFRHDVATDGAADLRARVLDALGPPDAVFIVAGHTDAGDMAGRPAADLRHLVDVNFRGCAEVIEAFMPEIEAGGHLAVMGSVATMRPRRRNSVYAACKIALEFYALALRHRFAGTPATIRVYRLGFLATRMTFGQKLPLPVLAPEAAAARIVADIGRGSGAAYLPFWWRGVSWLLNLLPWPVFRRLDI